MTRRVFSRFAMLASCRRSALRLALPLSHLMRGLELVRRVSLLESEVNDCITPVFRPLEAASQPLLSISTRAWGRWAWKPEDAPGRSWERPPEPGAQPLESSALPPAAE